MTERMAAGIAEKAFRDAFAALKPGGVLGVEEHRAAPGGLLTQFAHDGAGFVPTSIPVAVDQRPPMIAVAEYVDRLRAVG